MSEDTEFNVFCPHCGADNGHYSDFDVTPGHYWYRADCDECGKPFRLDVHFSFDTSAMDAEDLDEGEAS